MKKRYPKRVNPETMIARFEEIFKSIGMKKPTFRNLLLVLIAISVAQTFRINEIASRLPLVVKREKSKQKRFLRFLDTPLPVDALKTAWFVSVVGWFFKDAGSHLYLLVDETQLIGEWKHSLLRSRFGIVGFQSSTSSIRINRSARVCIRVIMRSSNTSVNMFIKRL